MNLLRVFAASWVALSFLLEYRFSAGVIGFSSQWHNGKGYVAAGSHPALLAWALVSVALFALLLRLEVEETPAGIPSRRRRFLSFLIDFWFSLAILASLGGVIPVLLEGMRTGRFAWHFSRNYSVPSDEIEVLLILITLAFMFLYFVLPLTKGKQTVGCFIMRLRVTPPFGLRGAFTFRQAARRVWMEFAGTASIFGRGSDRDSQGRTWYDRETDSTVILIKYEK
jgi:uncharacterized RDD family membrane protein YckC